MLLVFDTETNGFKNSHIVQLAAILYDNEKEVQVYNSLVKPTDWTIPDEVVKIHGITTERALAEGQPIETVLDAFLELARQAERFVAHNFKFDRTIVDGEISRRYRDPQTGHSVYHSPFGAKAYHCTMLQATSICRLPGKYGYKWPTLQEAHTILVGHPFESAHDALADVRACKAVYDKLTERK